MKRAKIGLSLFAYFLCVAMAFAQSAPSSSPTTAAEETRVTSWSHFEFATGWTESSKSLNPSLIRRPQPEGILKLSQIGTIKSVEPYDFINGKYRDAIPEMNDLLYETLFVLDPIHQTNRMYPLLAQALRFPKDRHYIIIEIDPRAHFQDGTPVFASDVVASYKLLLEANPHLKRRLDQQIGEVVALQNNREVRLEMKVSKTKAFSALMNFSLARIVKALPKPADSEAVKNEDDEKSLRQTYLGTGPYRLGPASSSRVILVRDPQYWAQELPVRQGFFNFAQIHWTSFLEVAMARLSLNRQEINFLKEDNFVLARALEDQLQQKKSNLRSVISPLSGTVRDRKTLVFNLDFLPDVRVRQALLLAFDFETMNRIFYAGTYQQPRTLLETGAIQFPLVMSSEARQLLADCHLDADVFNSQKWGHASRSHFPDLRSRLQESMRLFREAGYQVQKGQLVKVDADGQIHPLILRAQAKTKEDLRLLNIYKQTLYLLGIELTTYLPPDENSGNIEIGRNRYDLLSADVSGMDNGGMPGVGAFQYYFHSSRAKAENLSESNPSRLRLLCVDKMIEAMDKVDPSGPEFSQYAEALNHLHEALVLGIFIGESRADHYFMNEHIRIPEGLSYKKAYLYGYWNDPDRSPELPK